MCRKALDACDCATPTFDCPTTGAAKVRDVEWLRVDTSSDAMHDDDDDARAAERLCFFTVTRMRLVDEAAAVDRHATTPIGSACFWASHGESS